MMSDVSTPFPLLIPSVVRFLKVAAGPFKQLLMQGRS